MAEIALVDAASLALFGVAALRGFFRGATREAFTLAAVAAAYVCVRLFGDAAAAGLRHLWPDISENLAPILAGAVLAISALLAVSALGGMLRDGVRNMGLGGMDRIFGIFLGAAEGALIWIVAMMVATQVPMLENLLEDSLSLAFYKGFIGNG